MERLPLTSTAMFAPGSAAKPTCTTLRENLRSGAMGWSFVGMGQTLARAARSTVSWQEMPGILAFVGASEATRHCCNLEGIEQKGVIEYV